jgi:hypothetical protein
VIRRLLSGAVLATACLSLAPAVSPANPLDIPAAAPPQFRALLRAKLHVSERRSSAESRIALESQHGYRLMVVGEGNVVALVVMRDHGGTGVRLGPIVGARGRAASQVVTAYVTRGTVTPTRIEGSFGRFGSVAVRFNPSGRTGKEDPRRCRGHSRYTVRHGTFIGHIRFIGEDRYVAVRAHRAKGRVRTPRHLRCHRGRFPRPRPRDRSNGSRSSRNIALLHTEHRLPTASTELFTFQIRDIALLLALAEESKGRMAVVHYALALVPGSVLSHDDALTSATLDPPRPFHGKGIYKAGPDGTRTWGGSLSIAFPGAPRQPLAGAEFAAELEVGF